MNKTERKIYDLLNPKAPVKSRLARLEERSHRRHAEKTNAWLFLTTGQSRTPIPYGTEWDREYNPTPYPEARPSDITEYECTGVGTLYGAQGTDQHLWQLAGWNLTRKGGEHKARRK